MKYPILFFLSLGSVFSITTSAPCINFSQDTKRAAQYFREEFERLSEIEDRLWSLRADSARNAGLLTTKESEKFLDELLHA